MTHHKTKGKPWSLSPLPLHPPVGAKREQEQGSRRPKQSSWEDAAASAPVGLLSATHGKGSSITVTLGAHNIKEQEKTQEVIPVKRAIPHPDFNHEVKSNDIMLLQLERKVKLTPAVQLLRLPRVTSQVKPGTVCSVAGWGWMTPTGKPSDKLREVQLKVMEDQVCKTSFTNYNSTYAMCAGDPKIRRASFHGHSGGPLVCHNVAQGIVSYGPIDGTAPQVFTKVSHFLQWIENTMNHR
ncbi:granzyme B(G,H)-like [Castor canadensis]|uniref:Granzyme B(G,H)-like n=1 Tax=Castor canadensis TaxID=51338 RepID=A0AC58M0Y1_CASCN